MKTLNRSKTIIMTALLAAFSMSSANLALAEDKTDMRAADASTTADKKAWLDSRRMQDYGDAKNMLEQALAGATSVEQLRGLLQKEGYMITSINEQSNDDIEYEVVKGDHSFEVSADIDNAKLEDIEVANNVWRADETKRAMREADYKGGDLMYDEKQAGKYSDSKYLDSWGEEKEALEAALPVGKTVSDYQKMLQDKGYQITSINDVDDDNVEFEIVKGDHSFEVQLDRDASTKVVNEIDVSTNIWQSEETEKALGQE
ncbi:hypothetical protein GCM10011502_21710 [Oceanisphaera marina]|uniref:PepSY domain-containing protein n=1 Tax=Oceanisphaera marina TaxID=2017550 RepID=A0ABQ1IP21_9GAMM|nr:hypothetical protein [Oceanisphaera marina]GGB48068.1 hypothetical protein GCM10011502_21710 [Oceanisphaera marina]